MIDFHKGESMKKTKNTSKEDESAVQQPQQPMPTADEAETDDDDIEVNDPGDCIGHWAECEECEMCEIQDSCEAMTKNINGEAEDAKKG